MTEIEVLKERVIELEGELRGMRLLYNRHIDARNREDWTDSVTKAMRVLCDYVGRHPKVGESGIDF